MGRVNIDLILGKVFGNILWLNIKRFKIQLFWRILLILINFMLFFSSTLNIQVNILYYIILIATFSNILFIYIRVFSESSSINLFRLFGASKTFIILNYIIELFIEVFIAAILFLLVIIFIKPKYNPLLIILCQIIMISIITPIFSLVVVSNIEKQKKDL